MTKINSVQMPCDNAQVNLIEKPYIGMIFDNKV